MLVVERELGRAYSQTLKADETSQEENLMGRSLREKPIHLSQKLAHIRQILNLSQNEMGRRLGLEPHLNREEI